MKADPLIQYTDFVTCALQQLGTHKKPQKYVGEAIVKHIAGRPTITSQVWDNEPYQIEIDLYAFKKQMSAKDRIAMIVQAAMVVNKQHRADLSRERVCMLNVLNNVQRLEL